MLCFRCGLCCARYQAQLDMAEAQRIAAGLGLNLKDFIQRYADPRWHDAETILLRHENGECVFLERLESGKEAFCKIHSIKPAICREFPANLNQKVCWEGLAKYWDLTIGSSGQPEGSEEKIAGFQRFLDSLE
ncbi:MAG: YkgJ family cysteine cluster protein [Dehalococcoidia bacterium]|nr:YkgJ family cysteine cluster protein [Dehalococcoidia bacterium]